MFQSITHAMQQCKYCEAECVKKGFQKNGNQKLRCVRCKRYQLAHYTNRAWLNNVNETISTLVKESCGIRSIGRILKISPATVIKRIKIIAASIGKPVISLGKKYELDEMRTFVRKKTNTYWIAYAIEKGTKSIIDFKVGRRTLKTLGSVVDTLKLAKAERIYTDSLNLYHSLIRKEIHCKRRFTINHIERMNLTLRTHLKRLNRRTICYSRNALMLEACLKIYFWS